MITPTTRPMIAPITAPATTPRLTRLTSGTVPTRPALGSTRRGWIAMAIGSAGPAGGTLRWVTRAGGCMRFGVTFFMQNYEDWGRYDAKAYERPARTVDWQIYEDGLRLANL